MDNLMYKIGGTSCFILVVVIIGAILVQRMKKNDEAVHGSPNWQAKADNAKNAIDTALFNVANSFPFGILLHTVEYRRTPPTDSKPGILYMTVYTVNAASKRMTRAEERVIRDAVQDYLNMRGKGFIRTDFPQAKGARLEMRFRID